VVRVGKDFIQAECNGHGFVDWKGDPRRLAGGDDVVPRDAPRLLQLRTFRSGTVALEGLELSPAATPGQKVDLLARIDPRRDALCGSWHFEGREGRTLIGSPLVDHLICLPCAPPKEYRLVVDVERHWEFDRLMVLLSAGGSRFMAVIDGPGPDKSPVSGLGLLDGKWSHQNETAYRERVLTGGTPVRLTFTVRRDGVRATRNGQKFIDYVGALDRLSLDSNWQDLPPDVGLGLILDKGYCRVHRIVLEPLGPAP
jgi:hypothetical protein